MKALLQHIAWILLLSIGFVSCTEEEYDTPVSTTDGHITLALSNRALSTTYPEFGIDDYKENTVEYVDVFFYQTGKHDNCVLHVTCEDIAEAGVDGEQKLIKKTARLTVPQGLLDGAEYDIYVVANARFMDWEEDFSISSLKDKAISTDFTKEQSSFIMDGLLERQTLTLGIEVRTISLSRLASKISLVPTVNESITTDEGIVWTPNKEGMRIFFYNGIKESTVGGTTKGDYFNATGEVTDNNGIDGRHFEDDTHYPFYSYSNTWEKNSDNEAYFILLLPWKHDDGQGGFTQVNYFYRIPVNDVSYSLKRNTYYKINLKVSILGSTVPERPLELKCNYSILNWTDATVDADIDDYKYLVVDKNYIEINNSESCTIGYNSSSEITVKVVEVHYWDYFYSENNPDKKIALDNSSYWKYSGKQGNDNAMTSTTVVTSRDSQYGGQYKRYNNDVYTTTYNDKTFKLEHKFELKNGKIDTFVPDSIILEISNKDAGITPEYVTVVQYPPIYIVGEKNLGSSNKGNVYINKSNDKYSDNSNYNWYSANGLTGDNTNPSMYIIHSTTFADSDYENYSIGDPRIRENYATKSPFSSFTTDYNNKKLGYYYPTDPNAKDVIAPQFRIASSYGVVFPINFTDAKKRCAAYQEAGYKAGRWRIPTDAEVKFINGLSTKGKIPALFTAGSNYWVASGNHCNSGNISSPSENKAYVCCVYDEWYWGTDRLSNYKQFVWGNDVVY